MSEADMSMTRMAMDPNNTQDRVFAQFYKHAKHNPAKSKEEGRPIYDDLDYVMIMAPGDKDNIVRRPARQSDIERFHKQWEQYKRGVETQVQDGTPLEKWPLVTRSQVEELKFFGVHTVEALAMMPDSQAQRFMGINRLKQKAKDYMEAAKSEAPLIQLREENDALKAQLEDTRREMTEMMNQIKKLQRESKKAAVEE